MLNSDFCADASRYERSARLAGANLRGAESGPGGGETTNSRFRLIIKDLDAGGPSTARTRGAGGDATSVPGALQRVIVVPIYFHNALKKSAQDLSIHDDAGGPPSYNLCHQPWVNMTIDWAAGSSAAAAICEASMCLAHPRAARMGHLERRVHAPSSPGPREPAPRDISICSTCDLPWRGRTRGEREPSASATTCSRRAGRSSSGSGAASAHVLGHGARSARHSAELRYSKRPCRPPSVRPVASSRCRDSLMRCSSPTRNTGRRAG